MVLNLVMNVWRFFVAVAVSWEVVMLVVPGASKVTLTPCTTPITVLELLNWSAR